MVPLVPFVFPLAHVDGGVKVLLYNIKKMNDVPFAPFLILQTTSIWPFIEVEDKGRRSGLRKRVGTKTWVAMLCFPRSALRALSLSRPLLTPRCPG